MAAALISCGVFVPLAVKWPLHTHGTLDNG